MKKALLLSLAFAALLMTGCRKSNVQPLGGSEPTGETIDVALNAGTGDDKTVIDGLSVSWVVGDRIYVVGQLDGYLGYMTAQSSGNPVKFKGTIKKTTAAQNYYFYYVGDNDFTLSGDNVYTFSVANQHGSLSGNANSITNKLQLMKGSMYVSGTPGAELGAVTLNCMMSIIRLNLQTNGTSMTSGAVTVSGGYSSVKINTKTGEYVSSSPLTSGNITLNNASGSYYMAVITGNQTSSGTSQTLTFSTTGSSPASFSATIAANKFYNKDSAKVVNMMPLPPGTLSGEFSVSATTKVHFSQGNLQYLGTGTSGTLTPQWRFADNQYDFMGNGPSGSKHGNVDLSSLGYSTYNTGSGTAGPGETAADKQAARDLFGWGTTGYQDTRSNAHTYQNNYQPYSTCKTAASSSTPAYTYNDYGYGPDWVSSPYYNLTVADKSDWGCNTIYVGGTATTGWRTLSGGSEGEWLYLLNSRTGDKAPEITVSGTTYTDCRYAEVDVNGVNGLMVFPDVFTWPSDVEAKPTTFNTYSNTWNGVDYSVADFTKLQAHGVVFLPAAGYRDGTSLSSVGSSGRYWSSSCRGSSLAYYLFFSSGFVIPQDFNFRYNGVSVRLVR